MSFDERQNQIAVSPTADGIPWSIGVFGYAAAGLSQSTDIMGPGTYTGTFRFSFQYIGLPATPVTNGLCNGPGGPPCRTLDFSGQGTYVLDVSRSPQGLLQGVETATFRAPEPSTPSLLLLAFGGLGFQAWRRQRISIRSVAV